MRFWKDAQGRTHTWTPEFGLKHLGSGRQTPRQLAAPRRGQGPAPGFARSMNFSAVVASADVEGKGWLDEAGWQVYARDRIKTLEAEANRQVEFLESGTRAWAVTQGGVAWVPSVASHALGGRSRDEPDEIVRSTRQDVQIGLREAKEARTPSELAEADQHVRSATTRGEHGFSTYKENVFAGGDRTITAIKVGAVATTAIVAAPSSPAPPQWWGGRGDSGGWRQTVGCGWNWPRNRPFNGNDGWCARDLGSWAEVGELR